MISGIKKTLKKLLKKELITQQQYECNDYELLTKIINTREQNKIILNDLNKKNLALDVFKEILDDDVLRETYSKNEISKIYDNIVDEE